MDILKEKRRSSDRKQWVDVIRGVCVFLVVAGHLNTNSVFHVIINQIKMPMFYVIAGIFIRPNKKPLTFIKDSAFRLGFPWLIFSLIWLKIPYYLISHQTDTAIQKLMEFISGEAHWFVPSFFLTQVLFMFLWKACRGKKSFLAAGSIICFVIGYCTAGVPVFQIWCLNTALSSIIFIFIGYLLNDHIDKLERIKPVHGLICLGIYAALCVAGCLITPKAALDFHQVQYGNLPLNILLILAGFAASISLSVLLCRRFKLTALSILGRNTLVTYLISPQIKVAVDKVFRFLHFSPVQAAKKNVLAALIFAAVLCGICTLISEICGRFIPWSVGLRHSRSQPKQIEQRKDVG